MIKKEAMLYFVKRFLCGLKPTFIWLKRGSFFPLISAKINVGLNKAHAIFSPIPFRLHIAETEKRREAGRDKGGKIGIMVGLWLSLNVLSFKLV